MDLSPFFADAAVMMRDPTHHRPTLPPRPPPGEQVSHRVGGETWGHAPPVSALDRSINVAPFLWAYAPLCVLCFFVSFLLLTRKLPRLGGLSLRHFLLTYVGAEHVYNAIADEQEAEAHRRVEIGHLCFECFGVSLLVLNQIVNFDQTRLAFQVLQIAQLVLFVVSLTIDFWLLERGFVDVVRSTNFSLRYALCMPQVMLFAVDAGVARGFALLPTDVYITAVAHYSCEAVYLALEGLVMIGATDLVVVAYVTAQAIVMSDAATGPIAAFGLTCLSLSCASLAGGAAWKLYRSRQPDVRRWEKPAHFVPHHGHGHASAGAGGHGHDDATGAGAHPASPMQPRTPASGAPVSRMFARMPRVPSTRSADSTTPRTPRTPRRATCTGQP
jgi:hypothetical protein